jgi:hypothetical protein
MLLRLAALSLRFCFVALRCGGRAGFSGMHQERLVLTGHTSMHTRSAALRETIPPGIATFDYNDDGWIDILLVNARVSSFFHPTHLKRHQPAIIERARSRSACARL